MVTVLFLSTGDWNAYRSQRSSRWSPSGGPRLSPVKWFDIARSCQQDFYFGSSRLGITAKQQLCWITSARTKGFKPQFPNGIVSSVSFVSTTNTARSLAGFVLLVLARTQDSVAAVRRKIAPSSRYQSTSSLISI